MGGILALLLLRVLTAYCLLLTAYCITAGFAEVAEGCPIRRLSVPLRPLLQTIYHSDYSIFESGDVEIDQQADLPATKAQIGQ